ncbi:MAG TPA: AAA family ATPase [Candidatus Synoicihabitans sp.]|nr:AAA family ATPase [Candidatus Synoicihabitans sp.]
MSRCLIIAGPNGAGKTTFARTFLPRENVQRFINADLLAAGLSPLDPAAAKLAAGRLFLSELDRLATSGEDFAFESTLSGLGYLSRLRRWKQAGYRVEIIYLKLDDVRLSLERIAFRVRSGGHDVSEADVRRRFIRSWRNFNRAYLPIADVAWVFDVSGVRPKLLHKTP